MHLADLRISQVRNISDSRLELAPDINVFVGDNGAGKTSLLEALYILASGKSFRTNQISSVINKNSESLVVYGELVADQVNRRIGVQRSRKDGLAVKVDQEPLRRLSDLVRMIPIQTLTPSDYNLLSAAPSTRRSFMDRGVFHVKHSFHRDWYQVRRITAQRNTLLKNKAQRADIEPWDHQLVTLANSVSDQRREFIAGLEAAFVSAIKSYLPDLEFGFHFRRGWNEQFSYEEELARKYSIDSLRGYTSSGPLKADFSLTVNGNDAGQWLSRGQQKLVVNVLKTCFFRMIPDLTGGGLMLIDDITAELGEEFQNNLLQDLQSLDGVQIFVTCLQMESLREAINRYNSQLLFHVEHGKISAL